MAFELGFVCKAGVRKDNDRKIVPINPVSFESDFAVTSLQSEFHNSIGVLQALNCAFGMATTIEFIYTVSQQDLAVHIGSPMLAHASPNDTSERSQFLLGHGVIHLSIFSNRGWFQVRSVASDVHMNCVIIILGKRRQQ